MTGSKAAALASVLMVGLLAGCAGKGSGCDGGICVSAPSDPSGTYSFSADVAADNYTWDLGDNLGLVYGHDVQHVYDVANANLTVKLYAKAGTETKKYEHHIVRGTGINAPATFLLEAQTNWIVTNQRVRFSGAASTDPDHDTLRFAWACQRNGDAVRLPVHSHGNVGPPFQAPPAGHVTSGISNRTLPAPDRSLDPSVDLCDALGPLGTQKLTTNQATLEGNFLKQGKYSIFLIAADPAHTTVSGSFDVVVTPPEDRAAPVRNWTFDGNFTLGTQGTGSQVPSLQTYCDQAAQGSGQAMTCDEFTGRMDFPLASKGTWVNFTYDAGPGNEFSAEWFLEQGNVHKDGGGAGSHFVDPILTPSNGEYDIVVHANAGGGIPQQVPAGQRFHFHVTVQAKMDLDPLKYY